MSQNQHFSNPQFEPSDEELAQLVHEAFAAVRGRGGAPVPADPSAVAEARETVARLRAARDTPLAAR